MQSVKLAKRFLSILLVMLILSTNFLVMPVNASATNDNSDTYTIVLGKGTSTEDEVNVFTFDRSQYTTGQAYASGCTRYYNAGKINVDRPTYDVIRYYNSPFKSGASGEYNDELEKFFSLLESDVEETDNSKNDSGVNRREVNKIREKITEQMFAEPGSGVFKADESSDSGYSWAYNTSVICRETPSNKVQECLNTSILVWKVSGDPLRDPTITLDKEKLYESSELEARIAVKYSYVSSKYADDYDLEPYITSLKSSDMSKGTDTEEATEVTTEKATEEPTEEFFYPMISATLNKSGDVFERSFETLMQGVQKEKNDTRGFTLGDVVVDVLSIIFDTEDVLRERSIEAVGTIVDNFTQQNEQRAKIRYNVDVDGDTNTDQKTVEIDEKNISSLAYGISDNYRLYSKNYPLIYNEKGEADEESTKHATVNDTEPMVALKNMTAVIKAENAEAREEKRQVNYQFQFKVVFVENIQHHKKSINVVEKRSVEYFTYDKDKMVDISSEDYHVCLGGDKQVTIDNNGNLEYTLDVWTPSDQNFNILLTESKQYKIDEKVVYGDKFRVTISGLLDLGYYGTRTEIFDVSNPIVGVKNFTLSSKTPTTLKVKWDALTQNISNYQLVLTDTTNRQDIKNVAIKTTTNTSYTFSGLTPGHRYDVSIRAFLESSDNIPKYGFYSYCLDNSLPSNDVSDYSPSYTKTFSFTGNAITPAVTLKDELGNKLRKDIDYTVSYSNNVAVGTGTIIITGKGEYSGTQKLTFTIKSNIAKVQNVKLVSKTPKTLKVKWDASSQNISGYQLILTDTTSCQDIKKVATKTTTNTSFTFSGLTPGHRYDVSIRAFLKGSDNKTMYSDSYAYCLENSLPSNDISECNTSYTKTFSFTGNAVKPTVTLKNELGDKLRKDIDYTVSYSNNIAVGTGTITVAGKGEYSGTRKLTFTIKNNIVKVQNVKLVSKTPKTLKVKWDALNQNISGYKIILTDTSSPQNIKEIASKTTKGTSYTFSGLTPGHRYDVSVRAFLRGTNNTIAYSTSYAYCLDNRLPSNDISECNTSYTKTFSFTGNAIKPTVILKNEFGDKLRKDIDYTVSYSNNIAVGTGTITVTGKGEYLGTLRLTFTIKNNIAKVQNVKLVSKTPKTLKLKWDALNQNISGYQLILTDTTSRQDIKKVATKTTTNTSFTFSGLTPGHRYDVSVRAFLKGTNNTIAYSTSHAYCLVNCLPSNDIEEYTASYRKTIAFTGNAITPAVTLKDEFGNQPRKDIDYTVLYSNNIAVGTGTITVTGKGEYSGTQKLTFKIKSDIGKVQNVKLVSKTSTTLKVKWSAASQNISGYQLILTDTTDPKNIKKVTTKTTTATSYTFTGLTPGHRYDVSVRAFLKGTNNTIAYSTSYAYCLDNTLPFEN